MRAWPSRRLIWRSGGWTASRRCSVYVIRHSAKRCLGQEDAKSNAWKKSWRRSHGGKLCGCVSWRRGLSRKWCAKRSPVVLWWGAPTSPTLSWVLSLNCQRVRYILWESTPFLRFFRIPVPTKLSNQQLGIVPEKRSEGCGYSCCSLSIISITVLFYILLPHLLLLSKLI